jgi:hypothetical protein
MDWDGDGNFTKSGGWVLTHTVVTNGETKKKAGARAPAFFSLSQRPINTG